MWDTSGPGREKDEFAGWELRESCRASPKGLPSLHSMPKSDFQTRYEIEKYISALQMGNNETTG